MDAAARKRALRERHIALRRHRPPSAEAAERATRILAALPEFESARTIGLYAALPEELATRPLFELARGRGMRVAFPRTRPGRRLELVWCGAFEELRPGRYGVPEPPEGSPRASLVELDLLLVPGVAFDRSGGRLGRGGGYYDRALSVPSGERPFLVGFTEMSSLVAEVPMEAFDQSMDAVVTDREVLRREPE